MAHRAKRNALHAEPPTMLIVWISPRVERRPREFPLGGAPENSRARVRKNIDALFRRLYSAPSKGGNEVMAKKKDNKKTTKKTTKKKK